MKKRMISKKAIKGYFDNNSSKETTNEEVRKLLEKREIMLNGINEVVKCVKKETTKEIFIDINKLLSRRFIYDDFDKDYYKIKRKWGVE